MATFRGTLSGSRHSVSRLGHSHIEATANGWQGGVTVRLIKDSQDRDWAEVFVTAGSGHDGERVTLYRGPIDLPARIALRNKLMRANARAVGLKA